MRFWQDRPTLVTGATGLLGGHLVRRLLDAGADLVCLVRDWVPDSLLVRDGVYSRVKRVRGDICDAELIERVLGEYEIVTVFHLAAQTTVPVANRNPISTFETNIAGTWRLLEACRRSPRVGQIVIASSDKAYGEHEVLPYSEQAPLRGRHPYDVSKSCADLIAQAYHATWGSPVAITRCGNFFGPGDLNFNRLVPGTIRSVLRAEAPIIRSDGRFERDWLYVEDGAIAYIQLAEQLAARTDELAGLAFNFSTETPMTVLEIVRRILDAMGSALLPEVRGASSGEIRRQFLDASRAREVLGWKPSYTLEEGLLQTIEWYARLLGAWPR